MGTVSGVMVRGEIPASTAGALEAYEPKPERSFETTIICGRG
jgi:hypothetical protein